MPKIQDVLRLHASELSERSIALSLSISRGSVSNILSRAKAAGLSWPLPKDYDEEKLESVLFPRPPGRPSSKLVDPEWNYIHREMKRVGVTIHLLWEEYKKKEENPYQYSQFCERYRQWRKATKLSLRQNHRGGEKLFVDYAGPTMPVINGTTGEVREAQLFVATLGASSYTYAEAQWGQDIRSFLQGHVRTFKFFGGVPQLIVPDNLKSGVSKADRYEARLNRTYYEMANHFGCAILPARPYKPQDKAKVESAVLVAERWILAVLRNRTFFSLSDLNLAIQEELVKLNQKPFQKMEGSRQSMFEEIDKPALRELPAIPYEFAHWQMARVNIDYHISIESNYYSVPYTLVKQEVDVRMTEFMIEIFYKGKRVASHRRSYKKGMMVTDPAHRPKSHQKHMEWTPSKLISWGLSIGTHTGKLIEHILNHRPHPEQGYRSCLGIISLSKRCDKEELEAAAARAISLGAYSYQSVKSILKTGLGQLELQLPTPEIPTPVHENIRGAAYYQTQSEKPFIH